MTEKILLPDFEDMFKLIETIKNLTLSKMKLDLEIKFSEANIVKVVMSTTDYYQNGKPPSMEFVKNTYLNTGLTGELKLLKETLAEITADLEYAKAKFQLYRDLVSLYQTQSANERAAVLT